MSKPLTALAIKNMKPTSTRREIPDAGSPGLYLVLQSSGARSWALRCRVGGKPIKVTLGTVNSETSNTEQPQLGGYLTLAEARILAAQQRHLLAQGGDPRQAKAEALVAATAAAEASDQETVAVVVAEFLKKHSRAKKRRSADEVERLFRIHILPFWGSRQIADISKRDVVARLDKIAAETPVQANRVLANIRKMFNWAVQRDIIGTNPAAGVGAPGAETSRDRVLSDNEVRAFWEAAGGLGYPFGPAFQLLLLTAQRRSEVGDMRRGELELAKAEWVIPPARAKNNREHLVPLSDAALGILKAAPIIASKAGFVFTTTGATAVSGWTKAKARLDAGMREAMLRGGSLLPDDQITPFTIHDLRRTAASLMARCKVAPHVIEAVLNHKSGAVSGVAAVYNRYDYADEKRAALDTLAGEILTLSGVQP
jgi:integrase